MRIVIVDSEETSREVIKQAINTVVETHKIKSGCKIVGEAADGRKGCEIIVKERPDLIIMDLELPGKNGLPLLKKIRSEQIHSRVLVITKDNDFAPNATPLCYWCDFAGHTPNADPTLKGMCPYYSLWTPTQKTFKVNARYEEKQDISSNRKFIF